MVPKPEMLQNVHGHVDRRGRHKVMLATPMLFAINTTYSPSFKTQLFKEGCSGSTGK